MVDIDLYKAVLDFEGSRLGKHIQEFLDKDRAYKIERLIEVGCLSTDKDVARIAWSLTFTSGIMAELKSIKDEAENPNPDKQDVPEYT